MLAHLIAAAQAPCTFDASSDLLGTARTHALMGGSAALLSGSLTRVGTLALQDRGR